jgi:hypothetical protein
MLQNVTLADYLELEAWWLTPGLYIYPGLTANSRPRTPLLTSH